MPILPFTLHIDTTDSRSTDHASTTQSAIPALPSLGSRIQLDRWSMQRPPSSAPSCPVGFMIPVHGSRSANGGSTTPPGDPFYGENSAANILNIRRQQFPAHTQTRRGPTRQHLSEGPSPRPISHIARNASYLSTSRDFHDDEEMMEPRTNEANFAYTERQRALQRGRLSSPSRTFTRRRDPSSSALSTHGAYGVPNSTPPPVDSHLGRYPPQNLVLPRVSVRREFETPSSLLGLPRQGRAIRRSRESAQTTPSGLSHPASLLRYRSDTIVVESDSESDEDVYENSETSTPPLIEHLENIDDPINSEVHTPTRRSSLRRPPRRTQPTFFDGKEVRNVDVSDASSSESLDEIVNRPARAFVNASTISGAQPGWGRRRPSNPTESIRRLRDDPPENPHVAYAPGITDIPLV
jgi:hypothetical protein